MQNINVAIRAAVYAMLARLQALLLPYENAQEAFALRSRTAIATGKRIQHLHKVLKGADAALASLTVSLRSARDGMEYRFLNDAVTRQTQSVNCLLAAIVAAEEEFTHCLALVEEAKARLEEVDTETMQKHLRGIDACREILRRIG